ncbi:flagellar biosynthesis regulator FlaF [Pararhizobium haloflavum]|uniref:flagellar biosynthesis regulator FlaF n=1 Tax=Pararhizobium haloflavum TaxID=2037914 RepID=UPI000C18E38A|nr:flagellar biosynthesis regulator FlaF [Pararhizobium haloflavum]
MYQFSYAEIQQDDVAESKDRERQVLDRSIALLGQAQAAGPKSREAIEAIYFTNRVWMRFIEDLNSPENELEAQLRANLISVGLWILREGEKIRKGESENFQGIIDISAIIRDGLK